MSGEIARLPQPSGDNSSYSLQFLGPTLNCESYNNTIERLITPADVEEHILEGFGQKWESWQVPKFATRCDLRREEWSDPYRSTSSLTVTYRTTNFPGSASIPGSFRYFPCQEKITGNSTNDRIAGRVNLPSTGLHVLLPVTDTVCSPSLAMYSVNITHSNGQQDVSYNLQDPGPLPPHHGSFHYYNGTYEQWVHTSDALSIYEKFALKLNQSFTSIAYQGFNFTNITRSSSDFATKNGTVVETCLLDQSQDGRTDTFREEHESPSALEIWPLSVFERRPDPKRAFAGTCAYFDSEMAKELLINSTISTLSRNRVFNVVEGTTTRTFNIYRFRDKVAFFVPYGLSLGLGLPMIALGLIAFYGPNNRVSAITGGFIQILMTTTGRTSLEEIIAKGSGTLGGQENVSKELKETKIRFGDLIAFGDKGKSSSAAYAYLALDEQMSQTSVAAQHDDDRQDVSARSVSGVQTPVECTTLFTRAGFGLAHEVGTLRRRT